MPMDGENFKDCHPPPASLPLSRELMALLVSGPAGATDPVLWTLLLRGREPGATAERPRQRRARPGLAGLRACFAVALRAALARGP